jgi:phosphoserine phosphatase
MTEKWSPLYYFLAIAGKVLKKDIIRACALKLLSGKKFEDVMELAEKFYSEALLGKCNNHILDFVNKQKDHYVGFLVSSSIHPVVKIIADHNGFQFLASTLEMKDGLITGKLTDDLTGRKHKVVRELMEKHKATRLIVVTDNHSDFDLVKMADERHVVIKSEAQKNFWHSLRPNFIMVE